MIAILAPALAATVLAAGLSAPAGDSLRTAPPRPTRAPAFAAPTYRLLKPHSDLLIEGTRPILFINVSGYDPQVALSWRVHPDSVLLAVHALEDDPRDSCLVEWEASRGAIGHETWWLDRARGLLVSQAPAALYDSIRGSASWSFRCPALGVNSLQGQYDPSTHELAPAQVPVGGGPTSRASAQGSGAGTPNDYVYVNELPEVIERTPPIYPPGVSTGHDTDVVVVKAHVDTEGRVGECVIVKSVPGLDQAAIDCVQKWRFKPARSNGNPIAVWVAVPIKFTRPE